MNDSWAILVIGLGGQVGGNLIPWLRCPVADSGSSPAQDGIGHILAFVQSEELATHHTSFLNSLWVFLIKWLSVEIKKFILVPPGQAATLKSNFLYWLVWLLYWHVFLMHRIWKNLSPLHVTEKMIYFKVSHSHCSLSPGQFMLSQPWAAGGT